MEATLAPSTDRPAGVGIETVDNYVTRVLFVIGRIIVGVFYLYAGVDNIVNVGAKTGYIAAKGIPMPQVTIVLTALLLLIGGLSIITGYKTRIGVAAVVVFLLPVTILMHNFWTVEDPMTRMIEMHSFQSNMALMGSALMFLAIKTPWPFSLGGPSRR